MQTDSMTQFNSSLKTFELSGKTYELKKMSLAAKVWINEHFASDGEINGLKNFSIELEALNFSYISELCYYLVADKTDFPNLETFVNAFGNISTGLSILKDPLHETIVAGLPKEMTSAEVQLKKS